MANVDGLDLFIEIVQMHDCIWNKFSSSYHNKVLKKQIWNSISEEYGETVAYCIQTWKQLRIKVNAERAYWEGKSGIGANFKEEWQYYRKLMFLNDTMTPRKTESNLKRKVVDVDHNENEEYLEDEHEIDEKSEDEYWEYQRQREMEERAYDQYILLDIEEIEEPTPDQSSNINIQPLPHSAIPSSSKKPVKPRAKGTITSTLSVNKAAGRGSTAKQQVGRPCLTRAEWKNKIKKRNDNDELSIGRAEETFNAAIREVIGSSEKPESKFDAFGQYIAAFLNDMPKENAALLERKVLRVLHEENLSLDT